MEATDSFSRLRRQLSATNRWLDSWIGRLYLVSAAAAAYIFAYQHDGARPGASDTYPLGWFGWWDQGQYLKCTVGLAHGSLTQDTYWYPLGYPALGALFYRLMPQQAFFLPDLLLVSGIVLLFYELARRFVTPAEAVLVLAVFVFSYRGMLSLSLVEPWNTIPTHFLIYAVILLVGFGKPIRRNILLATLCVGLAYLCRPPDAVCAGLVVAVAVLRLPGWKEKIKTGLGVLVLLLSFVIGVLLINRSVFAAWRTPYEVISANIGFGSYPLAEKFFWLVIDAKPLFHLADTALLFHCPWLILLPPGFVYFVRRYQWGAVGVLLSIAATYGLYFAYNDFWPGNVFLYHLIHYLVWTLPILALITYVGLRKASEDRLGRWSLSLILPVVFVTCFLTLRQKPLGRILPGALPDPKSAIVGPNISWILFRELNEPPTLRSGESGFRPFFDYVLPRERSGAMVLLSNAARTRTVTIDVRATPALQTIDYGTLRWRLHWPPRLLTEAVHYFEAPPTVAVLGKLDGIDLGGPNGSPDGQPDEVIQVEGPRHLLDQISDWDIATVDGRGRWLSIQNPQHWWLIKVVPSSQSGSDSSRMRLRLCFPDYGDFERAPAFVLRAADINGNLLIDQTINK